MKQNESKLQQSCVSWFRSQYPHYRKILFAVPNGGLRSVITAARMKAEGVVAGVSDLLLLIPRGEYHGMAIEMKSGKNDLTESQQDFKQAVQKHGYRHVTCRTFDEFEREINSYLGNSIEKPVFYIGR